jgi:hypothetical protein
VQNASFKKMTEGIRALTSAFLMQKLQSADTTPPSKVPFSHGGQASVPVTPEEARFREFTGGGEYKYLLFPRTDVSLKLETLPTIGESSSPGSNRIVVQSNSGKEYGCFLSYTLDFSFNVVGKPEVSDILRQQHAELGREGLLDHDLNAKEIEQWRKILPFATAPNGNSPEVKRLLMEAAMK